jgi:preprotein translocase subunit SecG
MSVAEMTLSHPETWRRWFAFLGGGIAWTLHLLSIYMIGEFGCVSGWGDITYLGLSAVAWSILLVSVLLLVPAVAATIVGYRDARQDSLFESPQGEDEGGEYLSRLGWILSGLFTLIILVESLPVFAYLHGC